MRPGVLLPIEGGGGLRVADALSAFQYPDSGFARTRQGLRPFRPGTVITVPDWNAAGRPRTPSSAWLIARVQHGVTPEQVESVLSTRLPSGARLSVDVEPLASHITHANRVLAAGALGAALFVLIICAGNAGNLLLARRTFRAREIATRAALGASRMDLRRLWLIELAIMTGLSIVSGLIIASSVLAIVARVVPESYVTLGIPAINNRVVMFALLVGALTMTLGLSLSAIRDRRGSSMLFGRTIVDDGRRIATFRNLSVALQSALSMILAIGAALLMQSYWHVVRQQTGLDGDAVAVTALYPSSLEGRAAGDVIAASSDRLRRVPGIDAVAIADGNVVNGVLETSVRVKISIDGGEADAQLRSVSDGYFAVAGMDIILGRQFAADSGVPELVVNDAFAHQYWPDGSAIGRTTSAGVIVGIVRDAFEQRYDRRPVPTIYDRLDTRLNGTSTLLPNQLSSGVTYLLRMRNVSASSEIAIRRALFDVRPDVVVVELDTLGHKLSNTVRNRTFAALILSLFGIAGATVTITGLVGIVTTVVARRRREIAIRLAIGAQRRNIRWLITRDVLTAAAAGGAAGLFAGRWLSTWLGSFVYGVDAGNWMTAFAAAGVMLAIMTAAALVPTSRAVNLPPTEALRVE
jgi:putative ABC transport system permease protein